MKKSEIIESKNGAYVEVADEPLHVELFRNDYIRLYNASLSPGAETMFHRHSEDTVYIVHEGGWISTEIFPGLRKSPTSFPVSFGIHKKILMGLRLFATGSIKLPKSLFFCILSKEQPIVHRAVASEKNFHAMELMGVEITRGENHNNYTVPLKGKNCKNEYENDYFTIFRFRLKPGESEDQKFNFPGLMVCTGGTANYRDCHSTLSNDDELKPGVFRWHDMGTTRSLNNIGRETFEALIIALK